MKHPSAALLEKLYADFAKGDMHSVFQACNNEVTFQVPGKSKLAGKYSRHTFASDYVGKLNELSGGTFKLEVHDILASERHAVVLASASLEHKGVATLLRLAHVWRFEDGKPVAWYEYPRDLYQYDSVWS